MTLNQNPWEMKDYRQSILLFLSILPSYYYALTLQFTNLLSRLLLTDGLHNLSLSQKNRLLSGSLLIQTNTIQL